jgi:DNA mismatch repair protein MutL
LLHGRFPIAFLHLTLPADAVDVNVHPTKLEVRFADSGRIYSLLLGTIRKKFLATDLTARIHAPAGDTAFGAESADAASTAAHRRDLVDWAKGAVAASGTAASGAAPALADEEDAQTSLELRFDQPGGGLALTRLDRSWEAVPASPRHEQAGEAAGRLATRGHLGPRDDVSLADLALAERPDHARQASHLGFQIHNRYLVTENADGMVVIDQHALHERILYEQLREKVLAGDMETQRLLVPEPVSLAPAEAAAALEAQATLAQIGIEIEPFGGDTVLVSGYPAMLANLPPADMLRQVVEQLLTTSRTPERRDLLDDLLHMISCKAAIKAGDRLAAEEITSLLEQREHYQDAHHCPHGRPTALVFTREELDRRFKRT